MLRQLRPIGWNKKMPVHVPPLDCRGCLRYTCKRSGSLAQKGRIERSIASPGHRTFSGCQAFKNDTVTRYDVLAKLCCISITHAHDIIGPRRASWRKSFVVLFQTFEHVVS